MIAGLPLPVKGSIEGSDEGVFLAGPASGVEKTTVPQAIFGEADRTCIADSGIQLTLADLSRTTFSDTVSRNNLRTVQSGGWI